MPKFRIRFDQVHDCTDDTLKSRPQNVCLTSILHYIDRRGKRGRRTGNEDASIQENPVTTQYDMRIGSTWGVKKMPSSRPS